MLPALAVAMRRYLILPIFLLLGGCGGGESILSGTIADGEELTHVWVVGGAERSEILGDSFSLPGLRDDVVELRFARGDREAARMEIRELRRGAAVQLRGIAVEDGMAFPLSLEGESELVVEVNGVRLGTPGTIPERVDVRAALLSRSRSGDALLVRPEGTRLPDLRVVVTPGTEVRTQDGDPVSLERTDFGDTLRIVGSGEGGFVIATLVEVPRARARSSANDDGGPEPRERPTSRPRAQPAPVAASRSSDAGTPAPAVERGGATEPEPPRGRGRDRGRGPPEERGRGRGN
jgi:hypothetical protein